MEGGKNEVVDVGDSDTKPEEGCVDKNQEVGNGSSGGDTQNFKIKQVWKLYISRFLTAWGDRIWAFGFGLFLFKIQSSNLMLIAGYGLTMSLTNILFLASIGNWIDQTTRLRAAQILLVIQNSCVLLDCVLLALYFQYYDAILEGEYPWLTKVIPAVIMILALVANLASQGSKIVVEKDWIVVVAGENENRLAQLNSNLRTIDLSCQTLGPIIVGFLFSNTTYIIAAVVIGAWNLFSVVFEYILLTAIYRDYPQLGHKVVEKRKEFGWLKTRLTGSVKGWVSYMTHDVRNAGLGLACLYMTVLGFGNITWGYCMLQCVQEWLLGILVAVSGILGIAGSRAFPYLRAKCGVERTGVIGVSSLLLSLAACVASIWLPGSPFNPQIQDLSGGHALNKTEIAVDFKERCSGDDVDLTSVSVMLVGIILARFGLWLTDLSVTQILQENVEKEQRGVIGGVQTALNSLMDLIKFFFVLLLPAPHTIGILIHLSYLFISAGALFLWSYAFKKKKLCCGADYEATTTREPAP